MKIKVVYIAEDGIEREEVHEIKLDQVPTWLEVDVPRNEVRITMPARHRQGVNLNQQVERGGEEYEGD